MKKFVFMIFLVISILIFVILAAGCLSSRNPTFEINNPDLKLEKNSTNGNMVTGTVKNIGNSNFPIIGVEVYVKDKPIGSFILSNLTSQGETNFEVNITKEDGKTVIKTQSGNHNNSFFQYQKIELKYTYEDDNISTNPSDYKFVIGNNNVNTSDDVIYNFIKPLAVKEGEQKNTIVLKGEIGSGSEDPTPLTKQKTFFIPLEFGKGNFIGNYQYGSHMVAVYQGYQDIVVIYWPQLEIAGWHRIYASETTPPSSVMSINREVTDTYVIQPSDNDKINWINSLPRA